MSQRTAATIVNEAFDLLGKAPVGDIEKPPPGEVYKRAKARYESVFDRAMKLSDWEECGKTLILPTGKGEDDDPRYVVQLPPDCLKIWFVNGRTTGYARRAGPGAGVLLVETSAPVTVQYARRLKPAQMTEELAQLCAALLAVKLIPHAGLTRNKKDDVKAALRDAVRDMLFVSGSEDGTAAPFESVWLDAIGGL